MRIRRISPAPSASARRCMICRRCVCLGGRLRAVRGLADSSKSGSPKGVGVAGEYDFRRAGGRPCAAKSITVLVGSLVLDRFLIERRIGSGGFGVVYEAWDGRLERPVAVKAIDPGGSETCGRVLREAQAAARLNHPGIVTLYEMGEDEGNALLVTQLVDGSTLDRLSREGELSDRGIGEIGADRCEAPD